LERKDKCQDNKSYQFKHGSKQVAHSAVLVKAWWNRLDKVSIGEKYSYQEDRKEGIDRWLSVFHW